MTECKIWAGKGCQQVCCVGHGHNWVGGAKVSLLECCISLIGVENNQTSSFQIAFHFLMSSSYLFPWNSPRLIISPHFNFSLCIEGHFVVIAQKNGREILDKLWKSTGGAQEAQTSLRGPHHIPAAILSSVHLSRPEQGVGCCCILQGRALNRTEMEVALEMREHFSIRRGTKDPCWCWLILWLFPAVSISFLFSAPQAGLSLTVAEYQYLLGHRRKSNL